MTFDREPLPIPSRLTSGFWEAARRHELVVQECGDCGRRRHYPQYLCPVCNSERWTLVPVSGRGHIHSFTVTHQPFSKSWAARVPYAIAIVELDEGMRMVSDLPDEDVGDIAIGQPVEVFFEDLEEQSLPRFRVVRGADMTEHRSTGNDSERT